MRCQITKVLSLLALVPLSASGARAALSSFGAELAAASEEGAARVLIPGQGPATVFRNTAVQREAARAAERGDKRGQGGMFRGWRESR